MKDFPQLIVMLVFVFALLYYLFRKSHWWFIPQTSLIKTHLKERSLKEIEMRFQETLKIKVIKSIFVIFLIFILSAISLVSLNVITNQKEAPVLVQLVRDKEEYKTANDKQKEIIAKEYLEHNLSEFPNQSQIDNGTFSILLILLIPFLFFVYMGLLKRSRLNAIYDVIEEKEQENQYK